MIEWSFSAPMERIVVDNRYVLMDFLGGGGMARVYLARDEDLRRDVALKLLRQEYAEDEVFLKLFRRESRSAATLSHPNVVQVYDARRSADGRHYIVMEYVSGGTLKERLSREGPLEPDEAARLASQVAQALRTAHERGVVHRDVKSRNILLSKSGDAKVTDFGIALAADATTISQPGPRLGTARYMAPELATGAAATPRSDLYSLGVVLYEMLTGEVPFEAGDLAALHAWHATEPPPHPRDVNPDVPKALDALVVRLLAKDPDDRLGSAAELVEELGRVRKHLSQAFPTPQPPLPPSVPGDIGPRRHRRRRPVRALVALVVFLALLGVLGWAFADERGVARVLGGWTEGVRASLEDARQALLGPQEVAVPDVVGLALDEARGRLRAKGLGTEVGRRQSSEEDAGRVLEQSVSSGRRVKEGSRVLLAVGKELKTVPEEGAPRRGGVPDLVGLPYQEAEETLQEAGFVLGGVVEEPSQTVPAGVILAQAPGAGDAAPPGSAVTLTTSTGAEGAPSSASPTAPASASASPPPP
jgi:tRNA A-37 threonylcarbamoyl transferase component Bud32